MVQNRSLLQYMFSVIHINVSISKILRKEDFDYPLSFFVYQRVQIYIIVGRYLYKNGLP